MSRRVVPVQDVEALADRAARLFVERAAGAIQAHRMFRVALAGGNTPRAVYARVADDPSLRSRVDWTRVQFFFGDERHVPPEHPDSNFRMSREAMLDRLPIRPDQIWRIKGEYDDPARVAREYEETLRARFSLSRGEFPRFDLVLLGLGPDGHTASLFPGTEALHEQRRLAVSNQVEKLDTARITLTIPVLNNASAVVFMVQGSDKAEALAAVLEGPRDPFRFPAQFIQPERGELVWFVDRTATHLLDPSTLTEPQS
jgi:6-phosphogluconolactonase